MCPPPGRSAVPTPSAVREEGRKTKHSTFLGAYEEFEGGSTAEFDGTIAYRPGRLPRALFAPPWGWAPGTQEESSEVWLEVPKPTLTAPRPSPVSLIP